jgi:methanethiol S-methyltransferase
MPAVDAGLMPTTTRPTPVRAGLGSVVAVGYAAGCYLLFVVVFGYAIAFLAGVAVPRGVDDGGHASGAAVAVTVDSLLLAVFGVQHSLMARPFFKRWWTTVVPRHVERSTYVLAASAALALVFWQWRPIPTVVWDVSSPVVRGLIWTAYAAGWAWVLAMSFAIDHVDLFGLGQAVRRLRGLADRAPAFVLPLPYRLVRHPMMIGFFVAFLAVPRMTVGHLLFAGLGSAYILAAVRLEERDLSAELPEYDAYGATTPRFLPHLQSPQRRGSRAV